MLDASYWAISQVPESIREEELHLKRRVSHGHWSQRLGNVITVQADVPDRMTYVGTAQFWTKE